MKVRIETYWLPKDGSSDSEYEDAFSPDATSGIELDRPCHNLAIADGATETSFSREWAKDLVKAYIRTPKVFYQDASLTELLRKRGACLNRHIKRVLSGADIPWFAERKAQDGAFAAILGLTLQEYRAKNHDGDGPPVRPVRWNACAIGDCCVFHVRGRKLIKSFPLTKASDFNNRPYLLSSNSARNGALADYRKQHTRRVQYGDELFLMTDALACWFLHRWELQSDPLELLSHIRSDAEFADLIARERHDRLSDGTPLLRNDDVTMTRCVIRKD